jgi:hypothetical protein
MRLSCLVGFAALFALPTASSSRAQVASSPPIEELAAELASGDPVAEQRFWDLVEERGAPLVEPAG